jgi:imidazolonepropionase
MSKIIIKNIKELIQVETDQAKLLVKGNEMKSLPTLKNAWLAIEDDLIVDFGKMDDFPEIIDWNNLEILDVDGRMVMPAFCDSHTHIVFSASREGEFVDRINGLTYEEIAKKGGGILNSAKKLANKSEEELYESAWNRLEEIKSTGTGAVEIKSGYGLSVEAELKMLRVIKRLKEDSDLTIKATFLGAHAIPTQFKENRKEYIDLIINEMIPLIESENLAEYIDVFCETNYYTPEETNQILEAGIKAGLTPKIHVNQFTSIGGIQVGIKNKALSVDHLEVMTEQDIEDLSKSEVMPTVLPSCSFFLNIPYAPARRLIDNGLPLCLATDFNPGSFSM